ncbi:hypothetical protein ACEWY4_004510 [Coilia grayii]|uniref:Ubiquitin carboxyl-terminal hydrolase n=1 Tax=Coilia grayii TaxID=363190 RepID=A0ABD1KM93_9TELE
MLYTRPVLKRIWRLFRRRERILPEGVLPPEVVIGVDPVIPDPAKKPKETVQPRTASRPSSPPVQPGTSSRSSSPPGPSLDRVLAQAVRLEWPTRDQTLQTQTLLNQHLQLECRGLPNLGNTCYINSTLQCLYSLQPFCTQLLEQEKVWRVEPSAVLLRSSAEKVKVAIISQLKSLIALRNQEFKGNSENDAHEFLSECLLRLQDTGRALATIHQAYRCPVDTLLSFQLRYSRTCQSCGMGSTREELNIMLSLDLVTQGSVKQCLQLFFTGLNPPPKEDLPPDPHQKTPGTHTGTTPGAQSGKTTFQLVGVISHIGSDATDGHYIADCWENGQWAVFNDALVTKASEEAVLRDRERTAYILFYLKQKNRTLCREFTGPTPHSVAVRARLPAFRPPDHVIVERRKQEAARDKILEFTRDQSTCDMRMRWEKNSDRQIVLGTIDRRVKDAMEKYQLNIEERRDRLHALLEAEERALMREMEERTETILERQAKMREKAKALREKRESDRQKVVAEKLEQLFRERSEELRAVETRRRQDEVYSERAAQIRMQEETRRQRADEERLFAQLWESDRQAKQRRESLEAQRQRQSNAEQGAFLRMQIEAMEQQRAEARRLKEEEAMILREQREMLQLEEERQRRQKLQSQASRRRLLDKSLRLKMKQLAREQQDELALDMSILQQLLAEEKNEKQGEAARKLELREEQSRYQRYLAEQLEEQRRLEAETEQLIEAELQQTWARRDEKTHRQREARDRLMADVLDTRRLQIQQKLNKNMERQAELAKEREELNTTIQQNKMLDEEEKRRLKEATQEYQADLLAQMLHQQQLREAERAEAEREHDKGLVAQEEYTRKVQDMLSRPTSNTTPVHPFRRRDLQPSAMTAAQLDLSLA